MSSVVSRAGSELPDIDDRLVAPETRYEMYDGELVEVSPADPPHAERHLQLAALIEAHTGLEVEAAADLLTRTSRVDDVAPDVSVYPEAPDPRTGGRQLEQLAFEIVSTQTLGDAGRKAARLAGRGVRRVFAIDVERSRALEWSGELGTWRELDPAGQIEDPALAVPLPIEAMIHAAKADDAVQRALIAKGNRVLEGHVGPAPGGSQGRGLPGGPGARQGRGAARGPGGTWDRRRGCRACADPRGAGPRTARALARRRRDLRGGRRAVHGARRTVTLALGRNAWSIGKTRSVQCSARAAGVRTVLTARPVN